jgi:phosphinothricin acetyltransferase
LITLGYFQGLAGIALPNDASVALHESVGFLPIGVYR